MKWYDTNYCNPHDWIMDNLDDLNLDLNEAMVCLLIEFFNRHHINITYGLLKAKLKLNDVEVDSIIQTLANKGYINISMKDNGINYDITPLYDGLDEYKLDVKHNIYDIFSETFKRPLSHDDLSKLARLTKAYDEKSIINALRKAEAYEKLSLAYIETILKNG